MSVGVKRGNTRAEQMFFALHAIADIARQTSHVAFVPNPDV
jgi:hypothetical protein